jgi:hypothetical protein
MELCTLHPLDLDVVRQYVDAVTGSGAILLNGVPPAWLERTLAAAKRGYERAATGDEAGANAVSFALAQVLATVQPTFIPTGVGLSIWEARIDRGVGMLMRPPSRLFVDAGLDIVAARAMPIRLDLTRGLMGGAFVPARLVPDLERLLDERMARQLRRLADAEVDGVAVLGLMLDACAYARRQGLGLYEAMDVITPEAPEADPPGARIVVAGRKRLDPALRRRLEAAAKPPKPPGLIARLRGRGAARLPFPDDGQTHGQQEGGRDDRR